MDDINNNLTKHNKKSNFYYSFLFLPKEKSFAINLVYAFCQLSDDIVDSDTPLEERIKNINEWKSEFLKGKDGNSKFPIQNEVYKIIKKYNIPSIYFTQLLDGMETDLIKYRYTDFEDLSKYCYNAASTVGLISSKIFGYQNPQSEDYAIYLGIALQMTNILRDIKQDFLAGRIYLPQDELKRFSLSETDLKEDILSDNFISMMEFQYKRIIEIYKKSDQLLSKEDRKNFVAARIMRNIYFQILLKIKKNNYNIFKEKIRLSKFEKIFIVIKTLLSL
jgi:15-cis-phytoene synthase